MKFLFFVLSATCLFLFSGLSFYAGHRYCPNPLNSQSKTGPDPYHGEGGVPTYININGDAWWVVATDKLDKDVGAQTECDRNTIFYDFRADTTHLRRNLLHEIYHAAVCGKKQGAMYWNSPEPEGSHPGIYNLGDFSANFFPANPEFTKWLINEKSISRTGG